MSRSAKLPSRSSLSLLLVLALVLPALLSGCQSIQAVWGGGTHKITDSMGRQVELPRRINRIVSLAPANTEILYAVGAGAKVVGVTEYCNYPAETASLTKVGGYLDINIEAVVALQPDVVLVSTIHREPVEQLESLGVKCVVVEPRNIADAYRDIALVGQLVGEVKQAQAVIDSMKAKVTAVEAKVKDIPEADRPLVFYEVWDDPLMSAGPETYTHEIIVLAGGRNLTADATADYPIIGHEVVVARNPDLIVFPTYHGSVPPTADVLAMRPGWAGTKAVSNNAIAGIDADITARGGPRLADAVAEMAKLIYPDLFR